MDLADVRSKATLEILVIFRFFFFFFSSLVFSFGPSVFHIKQPVRVNRHRVKRSEGKMGCAARGCSARGGKRDLSITFCEASHPNTTSPESSVMSQSQPHLFSSPDIWKPRRTPARGGFRCTMIRATLAAGTRFFTVVLEGFHPVLSITQRRSTFRPLVFSFLFPFCDPKNGQQGPIDIDAQPSHLAHNPSFTLSHAFGSQSLYMVPDKNPVSILFCQWSKNCCCARLCFRGHLPGLGGTWVRLGVG